MFVWWKSLKLLLLISFLFSSEHIRILILRVSQDPSNIWRGSLYKPWGTQWEGFFFFFFLFGYDCMYSGLPRWHSGKESSCQCRGHLIYGLIPELGRSPGVANGNQLQYSCLENSMGRGTWWVTVHGVTKSWTQLSDSCTHTDTDTHRHTHPCAHMVHRMRTRFPLLNSK